MAQLWVLSACALLPSAVHRPLLALWFVSAEAPEDRWVRYLIRLLIFPMLQMAGATLVRISTATSMAKVGNAQAKKKLALSTLFAYQSFMTLLARTMLMSMGSVQDVIIATVIAGVQEFIARSSIVLLDNAVNKHVYRRAFDRKLREEQLEVWAADICGSMANMIDTRWITRHTMPYACIYSSLSPRIKRWCMSSRMHADKK